MREEDLYDLYRLDMNDLESLETPAEFSVWKRVWATEFKHVVIRQVKSVDTKDKVPISNRQSSSLHTPLSQNRMSPQVREQMRVLFREKGADARSRRKCLRAILYEYRLSIRAERLCYYKARTRANESPTTFVSFITDGASSE
jgi:hypothetical protein